MKNRQNDKKFNTNIFERLKMLEKISNTIKFLSADMIQKANSGHPGAPMGLSDIMSVLMKKLSHNPKDPTWLNRDRLVFSGGHASALVYSYLYLSGYDLSIDDLKKFPPIRLKNTRSPRNFHKRRRDCQQVR